MAITVEILKKIKEEIVNDPENIGYAGKTDAQIASLLNNPFNYKVTVDAQKQAPINRILSGVSFAPNVITESEVANAKVIIG